MVFNTIKSQLEEGYTNKTEREPIINAHMN